MNNWCLKSVTINKFNSSSPMKPALFLSLMLLVNFVSFAQTSPDGCEDCELLFQGMPDNIGASAHLAGAGEKGEPLRITGTIYLPDGKTPAVGIVLYVYQTDHTGKYTPGPGQVHARRHGHLRGWVRSDERGRYEFFTVRPASYPNTRNPQHIHPIVFEPKVNRFYWIDDYLFDDDPLLTPEEKQKQPKRGGGGILTLKKDDNGVWIAARDIVLGQNIPNYSSK
jgi:protocatechuate 3,4-dioxygenase, beta subunit